MTNKQKDAIIITLFELVGEAFMFLFHYGTAMFIGFGFYSILGFADKLMVEAGTGFTIYVLFPVVGFIILGVIVISWLAIDNIYKKNLARLEED